MSVVRCSASRAGSTLTWTDAAGRVVATRRDGERPVDLRPAPPYYQILPCPYCDADGAAHDPLKHVDPSLGTLGTPIEGMQSRREVTSSDEKGPAEETKR